MTGRVVRRLGWMLLVVWFAVTLAFAASTLIPSDPARARLGPHATEEMLAQVRAEYGLDDSLAVQYGRWLAHVAHADLGQSNRTQRPVTEIIGERLWPTAQLALAAILLQLAIGVPLGVFAAVRRDRWPDRATTLVGLVGQSAPPFFVGMVLLYLFAYRWGWFPIGGYGDGVFDRLRHLVLPAVTLALLGIAYYARVVRTELGDVLTEDYVRTARAKGLPERTVIGRHALRNALGPLVALVGLDLGVLLGGAVVIEYIFAWPGIGREVLQAILDDDLPVILGVVLVAAIAIAVASLLVDLVQLWLDPRLRDDA